MVRVRFAPSPTGELHVGGARTALYNYLFAKQQGGAFIVRIEDTDRERLVRGSVERILDSLRWLGIVWDEGPDCGGKSAPYVQSERLATYQQYAKNLVKKGAAYYCFCTTQRLEVLRELQQAQGLPTRYDRTCLKLTSEEVEKQLRSDTPHTIRLRVPEGLTQFTDLVRGEVQVNNATLDDQVLLKSDGFPTYHLANVVDDHEMAISHVIRGEEWLPSTPKHVLLYQAFGWSLPAFAHLPNVLNQKRAKLSKRKDGAAVWVQTYRAQGYLPEAMVNFLALLGWHPKDEQEVFSLPELTQAFDLTRVQKAGAIWNFEKLRWFNARYLKALPLPELDKLLKPWYREAAQVSGRKALATIELTRVLQPRLVTLEDAKLFSGWFFHSDFELTQELLVPEGGTKDRALAALEISQRVLMDMVTSWTPAELKGALEVEVRPGTFKRGELLWPLRVALTGERQSPDVFEVAAALGRTESLKRITRAIAVLNS